MNNITKQVLDLHNELYDTIGNLINTDKYVVISYYDMDSAFKGLRIVCVYKRIDEFRIGKYDYRNKMKVIDFSDYRDDVYSHIRNKRAVSVVKDVDIDQYCNIKLSQKDEDKVLKSYINLEIRK